MNDFDKSIDQLNLTYAQIELIKQAVDKHVIPQITSTIEELDKANMHLDSRSQEHWSAYNRGFISAADQSREALWGKK